MAAAVVGAADAAWGAFVTAGSAVASAARPWAEASTFMRIPALEAVVDDFALSVGQPGATVRYLLVLLLAYPLGLVFACLPRPVLKHAFSLVVGVFLAQFVFGVEWIHPVIHSVVAYILLAVTAPAPISRALGMMRPVLVFGWMLGYLSVQHLWRMHTDYGGWSLDVTGPTMILTIKVSSLAFNLFDGEPSRLKKRADHSAKHGPADKNSKKYAAFADRAVSGVPDPLAFFGYVFCFTSFFAGPGFDFKEYTTSVNGESLPASPAGSGAKDMRWGSRVLAALRKMLFSLAFLGVQVVLGPKFDLSKAATATAADAAKGELSLAALPFLPRVGAALLCLFVTRSKYYFAWLMSEGSSNIAGFGYVRGTEASTGKAAKPESWDGVSAIDVLGFETAGSPSEAVKYWNIRTQRWLFLYTFLRTPAAINTLLTNMMSAFWHGFYPGYYLTFATAAAVAPVEKMFAARVRPRIEALGKPAAVVYDVVTRIVTHCIMNYSVLPFVMLSFWGGIGAWGLFSYAGHIGILAAFVLGNLLPVPRKGAPGAAPSSKGEKAN